MNCVRSPQGFSGRFHIQPVAKRPPNLKTKHAAPRGWTATKRTSRHARGYGAEWDKLRAVILKRDRYLCQPCLRAGRSTVAREVDHIKPKHRHGTDDEDNLEAICSPCHRAKTAREGRARRG